MQIIVPMSGFGERFRTAGYKIPKPLIKVENKTIIQHVVELFDNKSDFIFICNEDHLKNKKYNLRSILKKISPSGKIISIKAHKLGPVHAVLMASKKINLRKQTIINYCDFSCYWDFKLFKKFIRDNDLDGAIPAYKGFHPHSINGNYYAYLKTENLKIKNIQEKKPFTKNPQEEYASSGTYYYRTGRLMLKYLKKSIQQDLKTNNEYYVSMTYKPMIQDKLKIFVYQLEHFMQWGTPADLEEYNYWSNIFRKINRKFKQPYHKGYVIMPMGGIGKRFRKEGYNTLKPLINVLGKPMFYKAMNDLPRTDQYRFIFNNKYKKLFDLAFIKNIPSNNYSIKTLNNHTDGQASTCEIGSRDLNKNSSATISACDNGMIYESKK